MKNQVDKCLNIPQLVDRCLNIPQLVDRCLNIPQLVDRCLNLPQLVDRKAFHRVFRRVRITFFCVSVHFCVSVRGAASYGKRYGGPHPNAALRIHIRRFLRFCSTYGAIKIRIFVVSYAIYTEGGRWVVYVENSTYTLHFASVCLFPTPYLYIMSRMSFFKTTLTLYPRDPL